MTTATVNKQTANGREYKARENKVKSAAGKGAISLFFAYWNEACKAQGWDVKNDTFRREYIRKAVGVPSLKSVRPGVMMNKLLAAVAVDANDWDNAIRFESAELKTWRWMLQAVMRQLGELTGKHVGWEYVQGILQHLRLPDCLDDCPPETAATVFKMLDTHRRRILKPLRHDCGAGFDPKGFYIQDVMGVLHLSRPK